MFNGIRNQFFYLILYDRGTPEVNSADFFRITVNPNNFVAICRQARRRHTSNISHTENAHASL
jgi:hypothetical protein